MHFTGTMNRVSPTKTSDSAKDEGKSKEQEGADELPWKRAAAVAGPILVVLSKDNTSGELLMCVHRILTVVISLKFQSIIISQVTNFGNEFIITSNSIFIVG